MDKSKQKPSKSNKGRRFKGNELKYLKEVLDSDFKSSSSGSMNRKFEKLFASTFGVRYAIASTSGTTALHQALAACGVGPGDEVIVSPLTVAMCGYAILYTQAHPVFADVDPKTFLIDPKDIEKKITAKTKAILVVHLYGQMGDMEKIMSIAKKHKLKVVEDCAQCYLASDQAGRLAGTVGDLGCFSLGETKMISSGEGGVVVTDNLDLANRVRKFGHLGFKNLSADNTTVRENPMIFQDPKYVRHDTFSHNYIMSEPAAAIALAQTERINRFLGLRRKMGKLYQAAIGNCSWLIPQNLPQGQTHSYWSFVALYKGEEELGVSWYDFRDRFISFGGDKVRAAWALLYNESAIRNLIREGVFFIGAKEKQGSWAQKKNWDPHCPIAEYLQLRLMQFTTNQFTEAEMKKQANALRQTIQYFDKKNASNK